MLDRNIYLIKHLELCIIRLNVFTGFNSSEVKTRPSDSRVLHLNTEIYDDLKGTHTGFLIGFIYAVCGQKRECSHN